MSENSKKVVILLLQYSVVAKGMERKIKDAGYFVETISENFDVINSFAASTDVFVMYLPSEITDDKLKLHQVSHICNMIHELGSKMMIIGEKKYHSDLSLAVNYLDDYLYLDRPVDNDALINAIQNTINKSALASAKKEILIVDDDPSYAGMVREWTKDTYKTYVVTAGVQAITFLSKHKIDLILLDYEMPVCDGPQVLQMLRQEEATADIPVIFLTGNGTKEAVSRVMELKPAGYILKTTTRDNLLYNLKKHFANFFTESDK